MIIAVYSFAAWTIFLIGYGIGRWHGARMVMRILKEELGKTR